MDYTNLPPSATATLTENIDAEQEMIAQEKLTHMSNTNPAKKYLLLSVFTCAMFLDAASNSMVHSILLRLILHVLTHFYIM
jgi:hypothetical protein